jgi:hypothetical protein
VHKLGPETAYATFPKGARLPQNPGPCHLFAIAWIDQVPNKTRLNTVAAHNKRLIGFVL